MEVFEQSESCILLQDIIETVRLIRQGTQLLVDTQRISCMHLGVYRSCVLCVLSRNAYQIRADIRASATE